MGVHVLLLLVLPGCAMESRQVGVASISIPAVSLGKIRNVEKILNDLKLSPFWKVEKDREGDFVAMARSVVAENPFDETEKAFLFEFMAKDSKFHRCSEPIARGRCS